MKTLLLLFLLLPLGLFAQNQVTRTEAEAKALIDALHERLSSGEDFSVIAAAYSEDLGSVLSGGGGEIGYMKPGDLVKPYAQVMKKTGVGQFSKPFQTQFGYHIVQVIGKRGKEYNTRHILIRYK